MKKIIIIPIPKNASTTLNLIFAKMKLLNNTDFDHKKLTEISFEKTAKASMRLKDKFPHANEVSMGMSNDFELAIKKGSTMIRIGTGIFGERH